MAWADESPRRLHSSNTSQVFLSVSRDTPAPSSETCGLILLPPDALVAMGEGEHTLESLGRAGSEILLRDPTERDSLYALPVAPRWARLLGELLALHPGLCLWGTGHP